VTALDGWDLFFDFRPEEERYGLYDPGAFAVRVVPAQGKDAPPLVRNRAGEVHPALAVSGARTKDGTTTEVRLAWAEMEKLAGARPATFDFAATFNAWNGAQEDHVRQRHLFGNPTSPGLNAGWGRVRLTTAAAEVKVPAIVLGASPPRGWFPGRAAIRQVDEDVRTEARIHPLTGEQQAKLYRSGTWACGGPAFSATCVFHRPSKPAIGVYDFEDDSGLRFFMGASAPCGSSMVASLGLFIFSESRFRCDCNPPIKASFALAPAEKRLNEDWAIYFDLDVDTLVRRAALNLGAIGDRRDEAGTLWLGLPRDSRKGLGYPLAPGTRSATVPPGVWLRPMGASAEVPMELEFDEALGPYRLNADRVVVAGTDRPWIYASGVRGLRPARMKVRLLTPLVSLPAEKPPVADGKVEFGGDPQAVLPHTRTDVFLRHDDANLYVAARRPAIIDRKGTVVPWARQTKDESAPVWADDSFEVFLSSADSDAVVHLALFASGVLYDALSTEGNGEDVKWSGEWKGAVRADENALAVEMLIPWRTLSQAGISRDALEVNVQTNQSDTRKEAYEARGPEGRNYNLKGPCGEALCRLGGAGRARCGNFVPLGLGKAPELRPRSFTVRLHFAELDEVAAGKRVFDVKLQGKVVLEGFDVAREAGGVSKAVVREFKAIPADDVLTLELVPKAEPVTGETAPIISGIELLDEAAAR